MNKILPGGLVAGIVLFVWGYVSHMVLPLGEMGVQGLPDEAAVRTAAQTVTKPGFYVFPYVDQKSASEAEVEAWETAYERGPIGVLAVQPIGRAPMSPIRFVIQLGINVAAAILAAVLLAQTSGLSFVGRILFVTALGAFAWGVVSGPYWNWYGFPTEFTIGAAVDTVGGWFLAGLVLAFMVRGQPRLR